MRIVGNEIIEALQERIEHHEKCRFAYISWKVPPSEWERNELVERHIRPFVEFEANGKQIVWIQSLSFESAEDSKDGKEHVIYKSTVTVDGEKKNIRAIKAAMDHLASTVGDAMRKTAQLVAEGKL